MNVIEKIKNVWNKFWNETLGADYTDAELVGLNINSSNKTEANLAQSLVDIDSRYKKNNVKSDLGLKDIKVAREQLTERQSVVREKEDEIGKERED